MKLIKSSEDLYSLIEQLPSFSTKETQVTNNSLLLTGATGFLGIHLLQNLVNQQIYEKIYIIVRNKNKLLQQIDYYKVPIFSFDNIDIIEGDLLSLDSKSFPHVAHVIHSAAEIHCIKNLSQLWNNNVLVTKKICDIYQHSANITFVSTLSVFVSSNIIGEHKNDSLPINQSYCLYGGYAQSKYISEKIVEKVNGNIIRLGLLTGSTYLGKFPPNDFFTQILTSLNTLQIYPENFEESFVDLTPVDLCAKIISDSLIEKKKSNIIHIANKYSLPLSSIIEQLQLTPVNNKQFIESVQNLPSLIKTLLMFAFFKTDSLAISFNLFNIDLFQSTNHSYSIKESFEMSNENLLKTYITQLLKD